MFIDIVFALLHLYDQMARIYCQMNNRMSDFMVVVMNVSAAIRHIRNKNVACTWIRLHCDPNYDCSCPVFDYFISLTFQQKHLFSVQLASAAPSPNPPFPLCSPHFLS